MNKCKDCIQHSLKTTALRNQTHWCFLYDIGCWHAREEEALCGPDGSKFIGIENAAPSTIAISELKEFNKEVSNTFKAAALQSYQIHGTHTGRFRQPDYAFSIGCNQEPDADCADFDRSG